MSYGAVIYLDDFVVAVEDRKLVWDGEDKWNSKGVIGFTETFNAD